MGVYSQFYSLTLGYTIASEILTKNDAGIRLFNLCFYTTKRIGSFLEKVRQLWLLAPEQATF